MKQIEIQRIITELAILKMDDKVSARTITSTMISFQNECNSSKEAEIIKSLFTEILEKKPEYFHLMFPIFVILCRKYEEEINWNLFEKILSKKIQRVNGVVKILSEEDLRVLNEINKKE